MKVRRQASGSVMGMDLSLRASAACALPMNWDHDLTGVRMRIFGEELAADASRRDRMGRIADIATGVLEFCREVQARHVAVEDHSFGMGGARAYETIEMTGAVKHTLYADWGVVVEPIAASRARKILLQHVPRVSGKGKTKQWVVRNVRRLGTIAAKWTDDECDAFVTCNAMLMMVGGTAMTFLGE